MVRPTVLFMLGGPGSGKGTQCKLLRDLFKEVTHISAGDCLRQEADVEGSLFSDVINRHISEGTIVPNSITGKPFS